MQGASFAVCLGCGATLGASSTSCERCHGGRVALGNERRRSFPNALPNVAFAGVALGGVASSLACARQPGFALGVVVGGFAVISFGAALVPKEVSWEIAGRGSGWSAEGRVTLEGEEVVSGAWLERETTSLDPARAAADVMEHLERFAPDRVAAIATLAKLGAIRVHRTDVVDASLSFGHVARRRRSASLRVHGVSDRDDASPLERAILDRLARRATTTTVATYRRRGEAEIRPIEVRELAKPA